MHETLCQREKEHCNDTVVRDYHTLALKQSDRRQASRASPDIAWRSPTGRLTG